MTREEQILEYANSFKGKGMESDELKEIIRLAIIDGAKWADSHPIKISLPPNLDEAAENSWAVYEYRESPRGLYSTCYLDGFKAGAEWMAEQGVKLHGRVLPGPRCNLYIESDCFDRGFGGLNYKFSDSNDVDIFVQIRKK